MKIVLTEGQLKTLKKSIKKGKVHCSKCGWEWDLSDGGKDPYTCHKCGHVNKKINENDEPNGRKTLNFFDLADKGIIWVVEPHENGERVKPNWEHDTNLITLWNIEHPDVGQEWVKKAIHFTKTNSIKWWNDIGQFNNLSDDKYNQILRSIELYKKKNEKDKNAKFLKCKACKKLYTQTTHKNKKSLPICPWCGKHNE